MIFDQNLVEIAEKFLQKGSKVYLEGQLQTRKWNDQSGQEKYTTEVVLQRFRSTLTMLDSRSDSPSGNTQTESPEATFSTGPGGPDSELDDEIPF